MAEPDAREVRATEGDFARCQQAETQSERIAVQRL